MYATYAEGDGPFLRIWVQPDPRRASAINNQLEWATPSLLEQRLPHPIRLKPGVCLAARRSKESNSKAFYRAKLLAPPMPQAPLLLHFIDFGFEDVIPQEDVRLFDASDPLATEPPQASDLLLSRVMHPHGIWDPLQLDQVRNHVYLKELLCTIDRQIGTRTLISIRIENEDLSEFLTCRRIGVAMNIDQQLAILTTIKPPPKAPPSLQAKLTKNVRPPRPLNRHPEELQSNPSPILPSYRTRLLEVGSKHEVWISQAKDGPELFAVQLKSDADALAAVMKRVEQLPLEPLLLPLAVGTVCLCRSPVDSIVRRAVVTGITTSQCIVFFVDYGMTDLVSSNDVYRIPEDLVVPEVFSLRFSLSGLKGCIVSDKVKNTFASVVKDRTLTLRVVAPEGPPHIQYGELYLNGHNLFDKICTAEPLNLRFVEMPLTTLTGEYKVLVSFVDSCTKLFVQLLQYSDELHDMMEKVQEYCANSQSLTFCELKVGAACCALFSDDDRWYRARIANLKKDRATVMYVDYGNEAELSVDCLKPIDSSLMHLRTQAIHCALKGYEDKPFNAEVSNRLESMTIETSYTMKVQGMIKNDVLLVDLIDESVSPAVNVAKELAKDEPKIVPEQIVSQRIEMNQNPNYDDRDSSEDVPKHKSNYDNRRNKENTYDNRHNQQQSQEYNVKPRFDKNQNNQSRRREPREAYKKQFSGSEAQPYKTKSLYSQNKSQSDSSHFEKKNHRERDYGSSYNKDSRDYGNNYNKEPRNYGSNYNKESRDYGNNYNKDYRDSDRRNSRDSGSSNYSKDRSNNYNKYSSNDYRSMKTRDNDDGQEGSNYRSRPQRSKVQTLDDPAPFDVPFKSFVPETPYECDVQMSWMFNPFNFYVQNVSMLNQFDEMMLSFPTQYKFILPISESVPVGSSVLAQFPEDKVLYRAKVIESSFSQYTVYFVDFGNTCEVNKNKVWQLENKQLELPALAAKCTLKGITPKDGKWSWNNEEDQCFKEESYKCTFHCIQSDDCYSVSMLDNNDVGIDAKLIESKLAIRSDVESNVADDLILTVELVDFDMAIGQCFYSNVNHIESFSKFYICLEPPRNAADCNNIKIAVDTSVYSNQYIECCYDAFDPENVDHTSLSEEFKNNYQNKYVIAYINNSLDNRFSVTLYNVEDGQIIYNFTDDTSFNIVPTICPYPIYNKTLGLALASHIESENELYLHRSSSIDNLTMLLEKLYEHYENKDRNTFTTPGIEQLCVAKSNDGNWYRAKVVRKYPTECLVKYIDYGNKESIPLSLLDSLPSQYFNISEMTIQCGLGVSPFEVNLQKLQDIICDKNFTVELSTDETGWVSHIIQNGVNILELVKEDKPEENLPKLSVYISHIDSPGQFWLQYESNTDAIETLLERLQVETVNYENLIDYEIGKMCIAKYSADEKYYRAIILDSDSDITTVRFIDYGNTDVLNSDPYGLKIPPEDLINLQAYAVKCSVNASPTGIGEWTEQATELFTESIGDKNEPINAVIILNDALTYVDLFNKELNITNALVKAGFATPAEVQQNGALPTCFASHVNSPSEFWIQLESSVNDLEAISDQLNDAENFLPIGDLEEGVICAAKFPEDGCWYRAKIIIHGSEGTEVLFMDYGNASLTNDLRSLPEQLSSLPALSRKCALQKPVAIDNWSKEAEAKFAEIAADGATIFQVTFIASGDISIVDLIYEGNSVANELLQLNRPHHVPIDNVDTSLTEMQVHISHCRGPDDFWVQPNTSTDKLITITNVLIDAESFMTLEEPEEGMLCVSLFSEDNLWYRSKVVDIGEAGVEVLHIDYGTTAISKVVKEIPAEIKEIHPLAVHCCLSYCKNVTFDKKNHEKFAELAAKRSQEYKIKIIDSNEDPKLVMLLVKTECNEDVNVLNLIGIPDDEVELYTQSEFKSEVEEGFVESADCEECVIVENVTSALTISSENSTYDSDNEKETINDMCDKSIETVLTISNENSTSDSDNVKENINDMCDKSIETVLTISNENPTFDSEKEKETVINDISCDKSIDNSCDASVCDTNVEDNSKEKTDSESLENSEVNLEKEMDTCKEEDPNDQSVIKSDDSLEKVPDLDTSMERTVEEKQASSEESDSTSSNLKKDQSAVKSDDSLGKVSDLDTSMERIVDGKPVFSSSSDSTSSKDNKYLNMAEDDTFESDSSSKNNSVLSEKDKNKDDTVETDLTNSKDNSLLLEQSNDSTNTEDSPTFLDTNKNATNNESFETDSSSSKDNSVLDDKIIAKDATEKNA